MRVQVVGGGALGQVYAKHLAAGGADVSVVGRTGELGIDATLVRHGFLGQRRTQLKLPFAPVTTEPDIVLICVRFEHVTPSFVQQLNSNSTWITLTPVMPPQLTLLRQSCRREIVVALPSVLADRQGSEIHYWLPPLARTLLEKPVRDRSSVAEFSSILSRGGLRNRFGRQVAERNQATTCAFFPLQVAVCLKGDCRALSMDRQLLSECHTATAEMATLSRRLGKVEPAIRLLRICSGPRLLPGLIGLGTALAPGVVHYIDRHFSSKLAAQHQLLGREIEALALQQGIPIPHLKGMLRQLLVQR